MQSGVSSRLGLSVYLLALGYGLGTTVAVISVAISGLIGAALAPHPALSTLPYGLQFVGVMVSAFSSSLLQATLGRKRVAFFACCLGIGAGLLGMLTLHFQWFYLLCLTHFLIGVFLANIGLLRFVALDLAPKPLHGKALSMVMFGGTFAALLGPFISRNAGSFFQQLSVYQVSYLAMSLIAAAIAVLILCLHFPTVEKKSKQASVAVSNLLQQRLYVFAMACGGVGYALMNMIMINTAIEMKAEGFAFTAVTYYIQIHVLAMFVPSLFNMKILDRLGVVKFLLLGLLLQFLVSGVFFWGKTPVTFFVSLLALGLAWNILYTAGSYIVGHLFDEPEKKFKAQGTNDLAIGMMSAVGSLSAGAVLGLLGWELMHVIAVIFTLMLLIFFVVVSPQLIEKIRSLESTEKQ